MFLPLDTASGLPIYRQIVDQVRRMIASGVLRAGDRLESVRDLAATLHVNPLTVAKAYQELERDGVVEMRRGLGVFVRHEPDLDRARAEKRRAVVRAVAERFVLEAIQAGLSEKEATRLLIESWRSLEAKSSRGAKR